MRGISLLFLISIVCVLGCSAEVNKFKHVENVINDYFEHNDNRQQLILPENKELAKPRKPVKDFQSGCTCEKATYTCGCCLHMEVPKIKLNDTGCVNVSYLPDQYGISLTFSLDGRVIINQTISARNPPPLCFGIPHLEKEASLCIDFYKLDISNSTFSGCIKVEARLIYVFVESFDLGCFRVPLRPGWQNNQHKILKNWLKDLTILMTKRKQALFQ